MSELKQAAWDALERARERLKQAEQAEPLVEPTEGNPSY